MVQNQRNIKIKVCQGSISSPLLLLLHLNDIVNASPNLFDMVFLAKDEDKEAFNQNV